MRRLAAALVLALAACTSGDPPAPTASPLPSPSSSSRTTAAADPGLLVYVAHDLEVLDPRTLRTSVLKRLDATEHTVALAVSADARYAAYLVDDPRVAVSVVEIATKRSRTWTAPAGFVARSLAATDGGFVVVDERTGDRLLRLDPAAVLAGRGPSAVTLRGVTGARLLTARGSRVFVATAEEASSSGGPETVYEVAPNGSATRLFADGDGLPEGEVRNLPISAAALTADGTRLVYGTGATAGGCDATGFVAVRDLAAGREVPVAMPPIDPPGRYVVATVTTGPDGRTVVGFTTSLPDCGPKQVTGGAFALDGTTWTEVARNATWAATGPAGHRASILGGSTLSFDGTIVAPAVFAAWAVV